MPITQRNVFINGDVVRMPEREMATGEEMLRLIGELSDEAQAYLLGLAEGIVKAMWERRQKPAFGELSALEVIGALVRFGVL